jgi:hypothetical protein
MILAVSQAAFCNSVISNQKETLEPAACFPLLSLVAILYPLFCLFNAGEKIP